MADTTLRQAFSNIANAIRAKGVTGTMSPLQMPTKVSTIVTRKYGVSGDDVLGKVNSQGELQPPSTQFSFTSSEIVSIPDYRLFYKFYNNPALTSVNLPNLTSVGDHGMYYAFFGNYQLTSVDLSKLTSVGNYGLQGTFNSCNKLKNVYLSKLSIVGSVGLYNAFYGCNALELVDFSQATVVPTIESNTFSNTNSTFQIVVPDSLYSTWIAATNWSALSSQIVKASEYTPAS